MSENTRGPGLLLRAAIRFVGPIPTKEAAELDRLRFTRALGLKMAVPAIPVLIVVAIVINHTWAYAVLGVWALVWLTSLTRLTLAIRRAR